MSAKPDDLDAIRTIVQTLEPFDQNERSRIIRWASEKLGMPVSNQSNPPPSGIDSLKSDPNPQISSSGSNKDIKTFLAEKAPKSDNQLAAAVAYYYRFEATEGKRKSSITKDDLNDACRQGGIKRLSRPDQTLINALNAGVLDKGSERGSYTINSVGENLVAMTMPATGKVKIQRTKVKKRKKSK